MTEDGSAFVRALRAEVDGAVEDRRRAIARTIVPMPDWVAPAWPTRLKWRVRRGWRWATGLRIVHKNRTDRDAA